MIIFFAAVVANFSKYYSAHAGEELRLDNEDSKQNVDYVTKVITNTEMRGDGGIGVDLGRLDQT